LEQRDFYFFFFSKSFFFSSRRSIKIFTKMSSPSVFMVLGVLGGVGEVKGRVLTHLLDCTFCVDVFLCFLFLFLFFFSFFTKPQKPQNHFKKDLFMSVTMVPPILESGCHCCRCLCSYCLCGCGCCGLCGCSGARSWACGSRS